VSERPYDGHVAPGGPPAVRELAQLVVTKVSVGRMDNNAYVLRCRATGATLLVDAAAEPDRLLPLLGAGTLQRIVTTHRHQDHWGALAAVRSATGARTCAHPADAPAIGVPTDDVLTGGDRVGVGEVELAVVHLVGHTPGSIALRYDDPAGSSHVFTGDSLFPGGVGRTASAADFASLLGDVERELFDRLPDETWVYPGHGDDTTLGAERPSLPAWRARGW
jgi:glyoxylase-like metal-dependent hydrolase (beta-lactamase superfamily II)